MNSSISDNVYAIPTSENKVLLKEKASKFIGLSFPVSNLIEVETQLSAVRKNYSDAHHYCYAWQLGLKKKTYKMSDDGEPAHSAGSPIYGQIKAFNLTNILVVVVRYFGGTKLGVGGLTAAYRETSRQVLLTTPSKVVRDEESIWIAFDYEHTQVINKMMHQLQLRTNQERFVDRCEFELMVSEKEKITLLQEIATLQAKGFSIQLIN